MQSLTRASFFKGAWRPSRPDNSGCDVWELNIGELARENAEFLALKPREMLDMLNLTCSFALSDANRPVCNGHVSEFRLFFSFS